MFSATGVFIASSALELAGNQRSKICFEMRFLLWFEYKKWEKFHFLPSLVRSERVFEDQLSKLWRTENCSENEVGAAT
jgi:hypothetical protein